VSVDPSSSIPSIDAESSPEGVQRSRDHTCRHCAVPAEHPLGLGDKTIVKVSVVDERIVIEKGMEL